MFIYLQHNQQQQQQQQSLGQQRIILSHALPIMHQQSHLPLINSPSSGNILHVRLNWIFNNQ
jgi:hypothetical protein